MRDDVRVLDRLDDALHLQVVEMGNAARGVDAHPHVLHAAATTRARYPDAQGVVAFDVFDDLQATVGLDVDRRIPEGQLGILELERKRLGLLLRQAAHSGARQQRVHTFVPGLVAVDVEEGDGIKSARSEIAVVGNHRAHQTRGPERVRIHHQTGSVATAQHQVGQGCVVATLELYRAQRLRCRTLPCNRQQRRVVAAQVDEDARVGLRQAAEHEASAQFGGSSLGIGDGSAWNDFF